MVGGGVDTVQTLGTVKSRACTIQINLLFPFLSVMVYESPYIIIGRKKTVALGTRVSVLAL